LKIRPELKWPNDLMLNGEKIAGIIIDVAIESNNIEYLVIGVGINFRIQPDKISKLINNSQREYKVATIVKENQDGNPIELVQQFLFELEQMYNKVISNSIEEIKKEWIKRSSTIGKKITVTTTTGLLKGKAIGIDETGALLLSNRGKIQRLLAGDITYNRG
jgi:BirA family biotin operon repressor/biotin-[acetyl-CoA-carboxylase] ligase